MLMRRSPSSRRYAYDYDDSHYARRPYDYSHGYGRRGRYYHDDDDYYPRGKRYYSGFHHDVGYRRDDYEQYRSRYYHPRTYVQDWPSYKYDTYSSPARRRWYYDAPRYEPAAAADGMWYDGVWCERDADGVYRAASRGYDEYAHYLPTRRVVDSVHHPRSAPSLSVTTPADAVPPSPAKSEVEAKVDSLKHELESLKGTLSELSVAISPKKEKEKAEPAQDE